MLPAAPDTGDKAVGALRPGTTMLSQSLWSCTLHQASTCTSIICWDTHGSQYNLDGWLLSTQRRAQQRSPGLNFADVWSCPTGEELLVLSEKRCSALKLLQPHQHVNYIHTMYRHAVSAMSKHSTKLQAPGCTATKHVVNCLPAKESAVKNGANTAHQQLVLHWDACKIDSLINWPDGNLSPHGWQKVLLKLVTHLLYTMLRQLYQYQQDAAVPSVAKKLEQPWAVALGPRSATSNSKVSPSTDRPQQLSSRQRKAPH